MNPNRSDLTRLEEICREAGAFIRGESANINDKHVDEKSLNSFVTYVDKEAELKLVDKLSDFLPEATFLTEEGTVKQEISELRWIIDPLDGTTNFIHSIPFYAVSVALESEGRIVMGTIYGIVNDEMFSAFREGGAFLDGEGINVSNKRKLSNSLLATGFPYYDFGRMEQYMDLMQAYMRLSRGIRRLGSAALDLAYVACGRFEGFYEYGLNPWDVAAGALILAEANGKVTDFEGADNYIYGASIVASNGFIHNEMMEQIGRHF